MSSAAQFRASALLLLFVAGLAPVLAVTEARAASGTDLGSGYEWIDSADGATGGPGFFDGAPMTLNPADNSAPTMATLPWPFPFYGGSYTDFWISDNGWISFADPGGDSVPAPGQLPNAALPNLTLAPFWNDLSVENPLAGQNVRHGVVNAANAYRIQYSAVEQASGQVMLVDVYLYQDGRVKFHYLVGPDFSSVSVGIDNADGSDGFAIVDRGSPATGVSATQAAGYAIDILPPALLNGECGLVPDLACTSIMESLPGALPENILTYSCSGELNMARERVYRVTLTEPSRLQATLTPGTATNLNMYLLDFCSERRCLRESPTDFDLLLGAGEYYIVVDAPAMSDEGSFTLDVACDPIGTPLTCGDTVMGDTTGGSTFFDDYPCAGGRSLTGAEAIYSVSVAASTNLRATLTGLAVDLDVLILEVPAGSEPSPADCAQWGDESTVYWGVPPGDYLIVVDGLDGAEGSFTLETECAVGMDCSMVDGTIDFGLDPRQSLMDDTTRGVPNVDVYSCDLDGVYDGSELIFELILPEDGQVGVYEPDFASGLEFFILGACNEGSCVSGGPGGCGAVLPAGTHYLVVDSPAGLETDFSAQLVFDPGEFNHWTVCQEPDGGTDIGDTVNTVWEFDDGAYCYSDPDSINYPDGCSFSMYVLAKCGTEVHIPLYDVESGHVRVYDVFAEEYLVLNAVSTGGFSDTGIDIQWESCDGNDPLFNNETVDIWFEKPDGLCGVFRIEFPFHSGFIWDLYTNCTGQNVEGFPIYDSLCGALSDFEPLPNVNLTAASTVVNCPDIDVTYTIENNGCAPAYEVAVGVYDDSEFVDQDVVPVILPGESLERTFTVTFPAGFSTANVTLEVDADDSVQECQETPGAGCLETPGIDIQELEDCGPDCDVTAAAVATPAAVCEGGTTTIDASSSVFTDCVTGMLEYQLTGSMGTIPWQASPLFPDLAPAVTEDYELEIRCTDPDVIDTCVDREIITVPVDRRPIFDGASITVTEEDCELGIELVWDPATFLGPTGTGVYNVYRSTISCADAVDPASMTGGLISSEVAPNFTDMFTFPGVTYYYVIEAEDATGYPEGCQPPGPSFGGATTRADAWGGSCRGILERFGRDPAGLPVVGESLRLGAPDPYSETEVTLSFEAAIDAGLDEHYHVLRSDSPMDGFTQMNVPDPPLLQTGRFTDAMSDQPDMGTQVLFYLSFVAEACHRDNRETDRFSTFP